jgi:hypothetical protein
MDHISGLNNLRKILLFRVYFLVYHYLTVAAVTTWLQLIEKTNQFLRVFIGCFCGIASVIRAEWVDISSAISSPPGNQPS